MPKHKAGVVPTQMLVNSVNDEVCFVFTDEDYRDLLAGAPILVPEFSPEGNALKTLPAYKIHLIPQAAVGQRQELP